MPPRHPGAILETVKLPSRFLGIAALLALALSSAVRADELKLKDGTKVSGTIVGFEDNSFKVKTSYGYAVVQKDQVVSISMSDAAKTAPLDKKPEPAAEKASPPDKPKPETASATASAPPPAAKPAPPAPIAQPVAAAPVAVAAPPKPPEPEPIREEVNGNTYTNDTYRFRMYKPPDWDVIASASSLLPGAIAAMGTSDETTYLLIGQQPAGKSLAMDVDATDRRLRNVLDNFRPLGELQITVSGEAAIERRFRGTVDQHEWSGFVVTLPRGARLYTIFGMTRADSDLVQIQENVIARTISSLQFIEQ
ncbi:MAG: hypothetical protein ABSE45_07255 [Candidatus Acidiferrales bacterium]